MNKIKFDSQEYYHIYNHSIGDELLFRHDCDYEQFILKMNRYLNPFCRIIVYCLLPNHFHILIKVFKQMNSGTTIEQTMKNFFNSYTRSYNSIHNRLGRLFRHGYKSKNIDSEEYLKWVIYYIHRNPIHHGYVLSCNDWKYSSYMSILQNWDSDNLLMMSELYGNKKEFKAFSEELTINFMKEKYFLDKIGYE